MNLIIKDNYDEMSKATGDFVIDYINKKADTLLCIAGGETPYGLFKYLIEASKNGKVDFSKCKFVGLDEWVGLGRETKGSCQETLYNNFFDLIPLSDDQICFFNGLAEDLDKECKRVDSFISDNNSIDIMVLGIGMNGHIGFNEPNVPLDTYCHVVDLDPITKDVSVKYFDEAVNVSKGISLGMKTINEADTIILMANGKRKAEIVKETINGEKTPAVPSSLLQDFPKLYFFLDKEAASLL